MKKTGITDLIVFVLSAELAGALSGVISGGNFGGYYDTLVKPPLAPPGWLFPAVWAVLYAVMGISAYLVYRTGNTTKTPALILYGVQLFVNLLWSPFFFGLKSFSGAVIIVAAMLGLIVCMLAVFARIDRCAALINLPYLAWTIFAAYLTVSFFALNT